VPTHDNAVTLCAFDLLELDGEDLRREPIEVRKATLKGPLRRTRSGIAFNRHFEVDGTIVGPRARPRGHRVEATGFSLSLAALIACESLKRAE
jgi:hypothetical protein